MDRRLKAIYISMLRPDWVLSGGSLFKPDYVTYRESLENPHMYEFREELQNIRLSIKGLIYEDPNINNYD